ncbi:hypothetical protein SK128_022913 [Halocaridina rubra]|uniref:Uncharacterized protein n=1 Tax=Halocaridina rubra TaxID=373956 RepID=A0AAN8WP50_HALRR
MPGHNTMSHVLQRAFNITDFIVRSQYDVTRTAKDIWYYCFIVSMRSGVTRPMCHVQLACRSEWHASRTWHMGRVTPLLCGIPDVRFHLTFHVAYHS